MNKREILLARVKKRKAKKAKASKKAKAKKDKYAMKYPVMSEFLSFEELTKLGKQAEARSDDYKSKPMNDQINEVQPMKWKKPPKGVSAPVNYPMNPKAKNPGEPAEDMPMAEFSYSAINQVLAGDPHCEVCGKPLPGEKRSGKCKDCAEKDKLSLIEQKLTPMEARYPTVSEVGNPYTEMSNDELKKEYKAAQQILREQIKQGNEDSAAAQDIRKDLRLIMQEARSGGLKREDLEG